MYKHILHTMMNSRNEFIIDQKLRKYEELILKYYTQRAEYNLQSRTLATMIGFLSIYGSLTQTQLKKLTKFSKSTISTGLSNLINVGYVVKEKLLGKREYKYFLKFNSHDSIDDALGSVKPEIFFLRQKIRHLETLKAEKKYGADFLLDRLKEAIEVFVLYQKIVDDIKNSITSNIGKNTPQKRINFSKGDFEYILKDFNKDVKEIENETIDFFKFQSAYSTLTEFTLIIFVYFITRKILTQNKIKELTGLSNGKISQVINELKKKRFIIKIDKEHYNKWIPKQMERQYIYGIPSISDSFFLSGIDSLNQMLKWEEKFDKIKTELLENRIELEKLQGYEKIKKAIINLLNLMVDYKKASERFSKFLSINL
ncbi:MAG: MarR family transcriptional regulator [Candidatus Lokiarchaeota archaeon]|nr:MarR family transcriptional regulator [Candidatus Lokiarchaeota archaeon]